MKGLRKITPYIPGEQPNNETMIKLNTNENPYPPSPNVKSVVSTFDTNELKRYSSVDNHKLKAVLAKKLGYTTNHYVIGNGSDEVLALCFLAFFNSSDPVLFPDLTYGFYKVWADLFHIPFKEIPLTSSFEIDFTAYQQQNGGIIIANPNAPTGLMKPIAEIEKLLQKNPTVIVIVDEAYCDFSNDNSLRLIHTYPNLIITRTFSKSSSLAGLRVGYAVGNPKYIAIIERIKASFNPYSVDTIAENLAIAAVQDSLYYEETIKKICQTRHWFSEQLSQLGFYSFTSQTNFLLVTHPSYSMKHLYDFFLSSGIYVRYFPTVQRLVPYLRITIGTQLEMEQVITIIHLFKERTDHGLS